MCECVYDWVNVRHGVCECVSDWVNVRRGGVPTFRFILS